MSLSSLRFSRFNVASQVFYQSQSRLSFALVNLKPIVPGRELAFLLLSDPSGAATAQLYTSADCLLTALQHAHT